MTQTCVCLCVYRVGLTPRVLEPQETKEEELGTWFLRVSLCISVCLCAVCLCVASVRICGCLYVCLCVLRAPLSTQRPAGPRR